jgi:crotonobetainyl-CoA:carnitine CoA-transferase CaiB-like acyl-CoA transferase
MGGLMSITGRREGDPMRVGMAVADLTTNSARVANRESLIAALDPVLRTRDAAEWIALLWERGIPGGPINTVDRVFADPQVLHREMLREIPHPTAGTVCWQSWAMTADRSPP